MRIYDLIWDISLKRNCLFQLLSSPNILHIYIHLFRDGKELDANSVGIIRQIQENEYGGDDQQASGQFCENNSFLLIFNHVAFL